ncbi:MAG: hypothetical protein WCI11_20965 [Candidatus Methylumidiphilus sp.]
MHSYGWIGLSIGISTHNGRTIGKPTYPKKSQRSPDEAALRRNPGNGIQKNRITPGGLHPGYLLLAIVPLAL